MLNEKAVLLLERVIKNEYTNVNLDSKYFDENEFYYEFKCDEKVSENDFNNLEEKINKLDKDCFVKLIRISGVYYKSDKNNEMINRISGKAFNNKHEIEDYIKNREELKENDHRRLDRI